MRKSFDGLCAIVEHGFERDPYAGDVFTFFNRRRTYVKMIVWDGNGFWLVAKRLEGGTFEDWHAAAGSTTHVEIDRAQLSMLLEGIDLKKAKFRRHYKRSVRVGDSREARAGNKSRSRQAR
jgi:transposase